MQPHDGLVTGPGARPLGGVRPSQATASSSTVRRPPAGSSHSPRRTLEALAARAELADRMCRHRWLAMETAPRAGAAWEEIDLTVGLPAGAARREYELVLDRQKALGLRSFTLTIGDVTIVSDSIISCRVSLGESGS